jgi:D-sedoheptulose 7-phosphate isomerase
MDRIVFTNGCFDIIHPGHVDLLRRARALGDKLFVGINSDESVRKLKGPNRPYFTQEDRKAILLGLDSVDEVMIFEALTPEELIHNIKPDVLVKGGDWGPNEIIGADFVLANGGEVHSLPLLEGYSSSATIKKLARAESRVETPENSASDSIAVRSLREHIAVVNLVNQDTAAAVEDCARLIADTIHAGKKVLICGNGGSAADAQHIAAEFVGRYESERGAIPAVALTTDTSALTAISNDYGFERVFSRQVEALASEGDLLIAISTSGTSPNVIAAVMEARRQGCRVISMTGAKGKKLASLSDACVIVPSERTARIQEAHITIAHIWCEIVDARILGQAGRTLS